MRIFRWSAYAGAILVGGLLGLAVFAAAVTLVVFEMTVPDYGGADRIAGLSGTVTVVRDENAVPHIFAPTVRDGYRALGYVHAQDRFFQMEFARRLTSGRMAEVIGPPGLRTDRFMRLLGLGRLAEATVETMAPETRAAVEAYAEGVNAWLASPETVMPPEFFVLGIDPEPWRPADSAAWGRLMALLLSGDWRGELLRARLARHLSADQLRDLWPEEPPDAPITLAALPDRTLAGIAAAIPDIYSPGSASNEWAVGGERSRSGRPLLANDPHLGLTAPAMWHLARIVTPGFTASGAALPGQPFFMIGQNGHVAWGLTTTHADTQDLFIERLDPADSDRYVIPGGGSLSFETRQEIIAVRGLSGPETLTVRTTRHGPVISDLVDAAAGATGDGHMLALSFAALAPDDRTADAIRAMNHARDAGAFREALQGFHAPMQNIVFADTRGTVGFVAAGRLPVRPKADGSLPVEGWTGANDWRGFVAFDDLPQQTVAADGAIINANNRVVAESYPYTVTTDWPESYRARRIHALLDDEAVHSPDSFAAIQQDVVSLAARDLTPVLLDLLPTEAKAEPAVALLADWDGAMARDRPEPLIFTAWLRALQRVLTADELGTLADGFRDLRPRVVERILAHSHAWCDDVASAPAETCADAVHAAWREAVGLLAERYGDDPAAWRWGTAHEARFRHQVFGRIPLVRHLFNVTLPTGGDDFTVNRASPSMEGGRDLFSNVHGPGFRAIFDLSDPDSARYAIAPGQSGHPRSPYYANLVQPWRDGRYIVLKAPLEALRARAIAELTLTP